MAEFNSPAEESRIEDLLATRSFILEDFGDGPQLTGLSFRQPILEGVNEAHCPIAKHDAPSEKCSCGFYVYDETDGALWRNRPDNSFEAVVRVSGRVVLHDRGLRAQCMEVLALASGDEETRAKLRVAKPNIPLFESLDEALSEFPITKLDRPDFKRSGLQITKEAVLLGFESLLMAVLLIGTLVGLRIALAPLLTEEHTMLPSAVAITIYMVISYVRIKFRRASFWIFSVIIRPVSFIVGFAGVLHYTLQGLGLLETPGISFFDLFARLIATLAVLAGTLTTFLLPFILIEPFYVPRRAIVADTYVKPKLFKPPHD